jgi:SanA protein
MKKIMSVLFLLFISLLVLILSADYYVQSTVQNKLYQDIEAIPYNKVALVLGTVKVLKNGNINRYYQYRIDAAAALFKAGKVKFILVSGDNSREGYDEPTDMMDDLIKKGVPKNKIVLDYAGFRTLDSVVRGKAVFGQKSITIVSQKFHNERAIFIANHKEIEAIGFEAKDVSVRAGLLVQTREKLARVKVLIDIIWGVQPKFLGEKIEIK